MPMSVEYRLRALKIGRVPQGAQEDDFYLVTEYFVRDFRIYKARNHLGILTLWSDFQTKKLKRQG